MANKIVLGCGYLGSRVASLWQAQGHRVFATTRSGSRAEELRHKGFEPVVCDVLGPAGLDKLPPGATVLYCVGFDRAAGRSMRDVYVDGLTRVLASLPTPRRFLYVSSTGVYGQTEGEEVEETAATEPQEESGKIVLEAEEVIRRMLPEAVILRFAGIYGPGRLLRRQAVEAGEALAGDADKWLNLIHVDDGAAAVLAAETRTLPGAYNISDDVPVRRREFYSRLAQVLGAPEPRFVPTALGTESLAHERNNRRILNRRMRRELGVVLRYPSFQEGLPACK
jgi:nucleoside-diphosphate-sugar epimerase